jgi:hypothetical protein
VGLGIFLLILGLLRLVIVLGGSGGSETHAQIPVPSAPPELNLSECLQKAGSDKPKTRACLAAFKRDQQQQQSECPTSTDPVTGLPPLPGDPANPAVPSDPTAVPSDPTATGCPP